MSELLHDTVRHQIRTTIHKSVCQRRHQKLYEKVQEKSETRHKNKRPDIIVNGKGLRILDPTLRRKDARMEGRWWNF